MTTLLRAAAGDLRKGIPPLGGDFLVEHDVTLDEAYDLADWLARGCDVLLELDKNQAGRDLMSLHIVTALIEQGDPSV